VISWLEVEQYGTVWRYAYGHFQGEIKTILSLLGEAPYQYVAEAIKPQCM